MTANLGSLVASVLCLVVAIRVLSYWGERFRSRPARSGAAYGIVQLSSTVLAGCIAAGMGASQWAVISAVAITCGGLALWFLIPALSAQAQLRKERDSS